MTDQLAASYAHCRDLARRSRSNFYLTFWRLPREKHAAMCALYAFLRGADDASDVPGPVAARTMLVARWRASLDRALAGQFDGPIWPALVDTLQRYQIPSAYLFEALEGTAMDLEPRVYETFADLDRYCYRVAGVVGLCCLHIWGFAGPVAVPSALACGTAFQITNILRDVKEDAASGRCYLPQEDLRRFHYSRDELAQGICDARWTGLMQFQVARAETYYREAERLFEYLALDGQRVLRAMLATYSGLLAEIKRRDGDVFSSRVRLGWGRKIWLAAQALWPLTPTPHFARLPSSSPSPEIQRQ